MQLTIKINYISQKHNFNTKRSLIKDIWMVLFLQLQDERLIYMYFTLLVYKIIKNQHSFFVCKSLLKSYLVSSMTKEI